MEAPKLLKNESFASFRKRAAMWEKRTGKKYPRSKRISMRGSVEDRILDGGIQMSGLTSKIDYSKDYNLDDEAKELALDPAYNKKWRESEEGKKFARQELAIQEAIDQDKKEDFALKASKGLNIDTSQLDNAVDTLDKLKNKETLTIPKEVKEGNKTESNTKPAVDSVDRETWLENTRNSPAARAGIGEDMRWAAYQNHQRFKEDRRSSKEARIKRRDERLKKKKNKNKLSIED